MKKTIIALVLALGLCLCFGACTKPSDSNGGEQTGGETKSFSVTFKQDGQDDIVKTVESGKALTDIPAPIQSKTGYTFAWNITDFSSVTEDITVTAFAQANTYTVTYDPNGGSVEKSTQEVVYDSAPTFEVPVREGFTFKGWTYDGKAVFGKWTIADNVTLVAAWRDNNVNVYTVTFKQNGCEDIVFEDIEEGTSFTEIPEAANKVGYTVAWDQNELAALNNITANVVVNAVETAKSYTVTLEANGGSVSQTSLTVTYGESYNLPAPTHEDSIFEGWFYDGRTLPLSGIWNIDGSDIRLTAKWDESSWSGNH